MAGSGRGGGGGGGGPGITASFSVSVSSSVRAYIAICIFNLANSLSNAEIFSNAASVDTGHAPTCGKLKNGTHLAFHCRSLPHTLPLGSLPLLFFLLPQKWTLTGRHQQF